HRSRTDSGDRRSLARGSRRARRTASRRAPCLGAPRAVPHSTTTTKRSSWAAEGARGRERAAPAARARAARGGGFARRERPPRRRPAQDRSESRADAGPHRRRSHEEPADDRLLPATCVPATVGGLVSVRVLGAILLGAAIVAAPSFAAAQDADRAA